MSLRETIQVSPSTRGFLSGRLSSVDDLVKCFSEAVRTLVSATLVDIRGSREMRWHCGTDADSRDDEFWVHNNIIMRILLEKISEIQSRISDTAPSFTW